MREYTASLSYTLSSPTKLGLVTKLVRGKEAQEALIILQFLPKKAGKTLAKVIKSALANAKLAEGDDVKAIISRIDVGRGPKLKRIRFTSRARVYGYVKHRSFVRVVLSVK